MAGWALTRQFEIGSAWAPDVAVFFGSQEASPKLVFFEVFCERHQFIALNMVQKTIFIECAWPQFRFEIWRMATSDVSWTDGRIRHIHPDFSCKVLYR
jgi:hypothetical protein